MIHSFLMIGQSNMAGRGHINEAVEVDKTHIKVLRNGRWMFMYRPVNDDRPTSGVTLAESFAEKYAAKYGVDVGLIPCADGGTSIDQWKAGSLLFDNAVYQSRLAQRTSTIAGILWHQGEADCEIELAKAYPEKFTAFVNAFRKATDLHDVPFIVGGLGEFLPQCDFDDKLKNYHIINKCLKKIADADSMMGFVSAEGLGANEDNLHFNSKSLYEFGLRYFDEFEKLRNPDKVFVEKADMDNALRTDMEML